MHLTVHVCVHVFTSYTYMYMYTVYMLMYYHNYSPHAQQLNQESSSGNVSKVANHPTDADRAAVTAVHIGKWI